MTFPMPNPSNGKSIWIAAASVGGLILAIVGAVGGAIGAGYMRDQDRIETELREDNSRDLLDAEDRGVRTERLNRVDALVAAMDVSLQREMRTLDDAMKVMILDLDRRVQGEITRNAAERHEALNVMRTALKEHMDLAEARFLRLEKAHP